MFGMPDCIVVPVDLSEPSLGALRVAASLAKKMKRSIDAVFAVNATRVLAGNVRHPQAQSLVGELSAAAKNALLESLASLDKSLDVRGVVREGGAAEVIEAYVQERDASLLVMGTHGRTGVGRWVLGSVAERIIRTVDTPTLVVPGQYEGVPGGPVLVAYDFSKTAERALVKAHELATTLERQLHVVHAYADPWAERRAYRDAKGQRTEIEDIRETALAVGMEHLLTEAVASVLGGSEQVQTTVRKGVASSEIIAHANEVGAAIVTLGSTGRAGVERALIGSTAQQVLRTAGRPLFVVH